MILAVVIVQFFWTVNAKAHKEIMLFEKLAPLVIEQCAVGLKVINYFRVLRAVLSLQLNHLFEVFEA